jgi:hypothetical protein
LSALCFTVITPLDSSASSLLYSSAFVVVGGTLGETLYLSSHYTCPWCIPGFQWLHMVGEARDEATIEIDKANK